MATRKEKSKRKSKASFRIDDLNAPELYINRELSWLAFNRRVLELTEDASVPLLERLKFLCICSSNLDEFFEIRVAGLKAAIRATEGVALGPDRSLAMELFERISADAHAGVAHQYRILNDVLIPEMREVGIRFVRRNEWNKKESEWVRRYFEEQVLPVLSPMGIDPSHPFPRVLNKSLNFIVSLQGKDAFGRQGGVAIVQAPRSLPRVIPVPPDIARGPHDFVFLSSMIHAHVAELFSGMKVRGCHQFRVTRDSDLWVDEEAMVDLKIALEDELFTRRYGDAVRVEVADNCTDDVSTFLMNQFDLDERDLYQCNGPVNLNRLMAVTAIDRPELKYRPFIPTVPTQMQSPHSVFDALVDRDVLLHHPFQSFAPVAEFVRQASEDPNVLAIKITLYRTDTDSVLARSLVEAARAGKEVTAVIELRARFDEQRNIQLATELREAGGHVVYGVVGYKTHAKLALIVRRSDAGELVRFAHLSTGNYHPATARIYTDIGLMTTDPDITNDVHEIFMNITGLGRASRLKKIWQAPFTLRKSVLSSIEAEAENARAGKKGHIVAKMNSLTEPTVIQALYEASQAGVQIDLIVRGLCSLRPGVVGLSESIRVRSIVGRFLEHSRIWYFENDGSSNVYVSSADWMNRNLYRRVEHAVPILTKKLKKRIWSEALEPYLRDNVNTWVLDAQGNYARIKAKKSERFDVHEYLLGELTRE